MVIDAREQFARRAVDWIRSSSLTHAELQARLRKMPDAFNKEITKIAELMKEEKK